MNTIQTQYSLPPDLIHFVRYETIKIRSIYIDNDFWYHYLNLIWATQRPEPIYFSIILLLIKLLLFKFFISYLK